MTLAITPRKLMISSLHLTSQGSRDRISRSIWPSRTHHGPKCSIKLNSRYWVKSTRLISRDALHRSRMLWCK